jgi:hypothetical protein
MEVANGVQKIPKSPTEALIAAVERGSYSLGSQKNLRRSWPVEYST